jgi:hypothetical protein
MRIRFIKKTKDIREGKTKYYLGIPKADDTHKKPTEIAISRDLGEQYVKSGAAVEIDSEGNVIAREGKKIKIIEKAKIEEDGEI